MISKGDPGRIAAPTEQSYQADDADMLLALLEQTGRNRTEAARRLGVSEETVRRRTREFGLTRQGNSQVETAAQEGSQSLVSTFFLLKSWLTSVFVVRSSVSAGLV